jgi:multicomponent Na+:H+ antiporter subunit G
MTILLQSIGAGFMVLGVVFCFLGVLGILRLPDAYSRLHASGKTSTLGILFICVGTAFIIPTALLKLLALAIFIIFSGPVGSHAIAAAIHRGTLAHNRDTMLDSDEFMALGKNEAENQAVEAVEEVENKTLHPQF